MSGNCVEKFRCFDTNLDQFIRRYTVFSGRRDELLIKNSPRVGISIKLFRFVQVRFDILCVVVPFSFATKFFLLKIVAGKAT